MAAVALIALLAIAGAVFAARLGVARAQEHVTIPVGDIWYCDSSTKGGECETDIYAGDTVVWDFSYGTLPHTVTHCGDSCDSPTGSPLWDSGLISNGTTFSYTFDQTGSYAYRCEVHPQQQIGRIVVHEGPRPPTATLVVVSPAVDFLGTETPRPTPTALPETGQQSPAGGAGSFATLGFFSAGVALLCAGGVFALRGRTLRKR